MILLAFKDLYNILPDLETFEPEDQQVLFLLSPKCYAIRSFSVDTNTEVAFLVLIGKHSFDEMYALIILDVEQAIELPLKEGELKWNGEDLSLSLVGRFVTEQPPNYNEISRTLATL